MTSFLLRSFRFLAIYALLIALFTMYIFAMPSDNPRIVSTVQIPRLVDQLYEVHFRGTLQTYDLSTSTQPSTLTFTSIAQDPLLLRGSLEFFSNKNYDHTKPDANAIASFTIDNTVETDITQQFINSPYKFAKDEGILFSGVLYFEVTKKEIDPASLLEFISTFRYCYGEEGEEQSSKKCSTVMLLTTSSKSTPEGAWIDPIKTLSTAAYLIREPNTLSELNIMLQFLPFSNKKVTFTAAHHLILTPLVEKPTCMINGIKTPLFVEGDKFSLELEPELGEFAVLYKGDFNVICKGFTVQTLDIGDKTNGIYMEFEDILKQQQSAIVIPLTVHKLPEHSPYFNPGLLLGSRPDPESENSLTCSFWINFNPALTTPFEKLMGDVFKISLESYSEGKEAITAVSAILSAATSTEAPNEYRKTLFKKSLKKDEADDYVFKLDIPQPALDDKEIFKMLPFLLSYTFTFNKPEKAPPMELIMPQCFLTYQYTIDESSFRDDFSQSHITHDDFNRGVALATSNNNNKNLVDNALSAVSPNRVHQVSQTLMNALGNPMTSDGSITVIDIRPVKKGPSDREKKDKWIFEFQIIGTSSGFDHLALDFPQEEFYFNGNYTCQLTQTIIPFPTPEKPNPLAETTQHTIISRTRTGQEMVKSEKPLLTTYWKFSFQPDANYTMHCPDMWIEQGLNVVNATVPITGVNNQNQQLGMDSSFDHTLLAFYAYKPEDIESVRFYIYSSKLIDLNHDTASHGHVLIYIIIGVLVALVLLLIILGVYARSRKKSQSDAQTPLTFQDEYVSIQ